MSIAAFNLHPSETKHCKQIIWKEPLKKDKKSEVGISTCSVNVAHNWNSGIVERFILPLCQLFDCNLQLENMEMCNFKLSTAQMHNNHHMPNCFLT